MNAVFELSWRAYPASVLLGVGGGLVVLGLRRMWQPFRGPIDAMAWMTGFRLGVVGLALVGIGLAWLWQQVWLLAIALGVGGEELLESSSYVAVLKRRATNDERRAKRADRRTSTQPSVLSPQA